MSILRKKLLEKGTQIEKAVKDLNKRRGIDDILIGVRFKDGSKHIHYPEKKETADHIIDVINDQRRPVFSLVKRNKIERSEKIIEGERKIIFRHGRALGDALMFTAGIRNFKLLFPEIRINVETKFPELFENNPYIDPSLEKGDLGVEYYRVGYPIINNSNNSAMHFSLGLLFDMISIADTHRPLPISLGEFTAAFANGTIGDPNLGDPDESPDAPQVFRDIKKKYNGICQLFARQRGDIHLTEKEKHYNMVRDIYGVEKYWLVAPGGKTDCTCKIWDWRRFQDVIDYFEGRIKFVIIGKSEHIVEKLDKVIDLTDKFNEDIRGLLPLAYHAEGCVSGISFLLHLAAAVPPRFNRERKPCISIYGGREPTSFTWYTNHQILHNNGAFTCCSNGGCWQSRVIPLPKKEDGNKRLCHQPVKVDGRTIPSCMDAIRTSDVIRAIEKYYDGDIYTYMKPEESVRRESIKVQENIIFPNIGSANGKEINVLASLSSKGGGEQSACMIVHLLRKAGWKVHFHPWDKVHENYLPFLEEEFCSPFKKEMSKTMVQNIPLLFYANDQIRAFTEEAQEIVAKSSNLIIGINYINSSLPKCNWIHKSDKLRAVIFQNEEKKSEFERDRIGFENTKQIVLFGAIDLDKYLEICPPRRNNKNDPFIVLKHCVPDYRKYVTEKSVGIGPKIHLWQKNIIKERDIKFYTRLLKDTKNTKFEFMEAHKEIVEHFKEEPRMVFHEFDSMPVGEFLSRGHAYLYRTSNAWRDNYPRVVAEALAAGLPVLGEPRDGTKDRIIHGNTGLYCIDYDAFLYGVKILQRKEDYRYKMAAEAKEWARKNLDPRKWVDVLEGVLQGENNALA